MVIKTGEEFIKYVNKICEVKDNGADKQMGIQNTAGNRESKEDKE